MTELRTLHTADLGAGARSAIRALMDDAFDGVSDDTYENVLGVWVTPRIACDVRRSGLYLWA